MKQMILCSMKIRGMKKGIEIFLKLTFVPIIDDELKIFLVAISISDSAATARNSVNKRFQDSKSKGSLRPQFSPSNVSPQTHAVLSIVYAGPRSIHSPLFWSEKYIHHQTWMFTDRHLNTPSLYILHWPESWSQDTHDVYTPLTASFLRAHTPFGRLFRQSSATEAVEFVEFTIGMSGSALSPVKISIPSSSRECSVQSSRQTAAEMN